MRKRVIISSLHHSGHSILSIGNSVHEAVVVGTRFWTGRMKILVDADACPRTVLEICKKTGRKYHIPVWTVASIDHDIDSDHHIVVGDDSQEADVKIMNLTEAGDVVITGDWGLATIVLGKGARCLSPIGREFHPEKMVFLLEEREAMARFRRGGGRTKGPRKRTSENDRRFESSLDQILSRK